MNGVKTIIIALFLLALAGSQDFVFAGPRRVCCSKVAHQHVGAEYCPIWMSPKKVVRLPICTKLAELSYETIEEGRGKLLPRFLTEEIKKRGISFSPLSYFVAEFSGNEGDIDWLVQNYPLLVCSFNPKLVPEDETVYRSAMSHVKEWMELVRTGQDLLLMEPKYVYCPNCCSPK